VRRHRALSESAPKNPGKIPNASSCSEAVLAKNEMQVHVVDGTDHVVVRKASEDLPDRGTGTAWRHHRWS
jgi:hypothetical protein